MHNVAKTIYLFFFQQITATYKASEKRFFQFLFYMVTVNASSSKIAKKHFFSLAYNSDTMGE